MLAYFDRPGTSNGPTEAINGRLEHLRGSALGFRNLTHYIARSLLEVGGFQTPTTPSIMKIPHKAQEQKPSQMLSKACVWRCCRNAPTS